MPTKTAPPRSRNFAAASAAPEHRNREQSPGAPQPAAEFAGTPGRPGEPGMPGMPGMGPPGGGLIAALDKDRNGELSADEIAAASDALKKLDRDGDGKLTNGKSCRPPGRQAHGPGMQGGPERMLWRTSCSKIRTATASSAKKKLPERMRENFAQVDANDDGQADEKELRQMAERFTRGGRRSTTEGHAPEVDVPRGDPAMRRPQEGRPEGSTAGRCSPRRRTA